MHSSDTNNNCIFHTTIQLHVPRLTSTSSIATRLRTNSFNKELSTSPRKIRCSLSALSISNPKRSCLSKRKIVRDINTQTNSHTNENHSNNMTKSEMPNSTSINCSSSIQNTLFDIWQGLNNNHEARYPTSSSFIERKCLHERVKKNNLNWKNFSKVFTSLLTISRTKKEGERWIQLGGHSGTFKEGVHHGYILKELSDQEQYCYELLKNDILRSFVPKYNGIVKDKEGKLFIELEDLLSTFNEPCIMDCKIGVRTYLEEELNKSELDPNPRADLYNKMIALDPFAPTDQENEDKKILKTRYMIWRESLSSTHELGFRIEAIKESDSLMSKEFQKIKQRNDVKKQFTTFIANSLIHATRYLERLIQLRSTCIQSKFFQTHELIGSSLLFVHDNNKASIWMIDFGKTCLLPKGIHITHLIPWTRGSHEDGYLFGLDNLICLFQEIIDELKSI